MTYTIANKMNDTLTFIEASDADTLTAFQRGVDLAMSLVAGAIQVLETKTLTNAEAAGVPRPVAAQSFNDVFGPFATMVNSQIEEVEKGLIARREALGIETETPEQEQEREINDFMEAIFAEVFGAEKAAQVRREVEAMTPEEEAEAVKQGEQMVRDLFGGKNPFATA